jgi:hypothetical protein
MPPSLDEINLEDVYHINRDESENAMISDYWNYQISSAAPW